MLFGWKFGLGTTAQLVPSKCSINVSVAACLGGATGVEKPTAHASFGASASTAFNLFVPSPTLGVATSFQFVPSHCIAEVLPKPQRARCWGCRSGFGPPQNSN